MFKQNIQPEASQESRVAQTLILEMIQQGASLDDVLRAVATFVDQRNPAGKCCIFLLDPHRGPLQVGASPASPGDGSSWSSPIFSTESDTLGSVTVHFDQPHVPSELEKSVVKEAAFLARLCVERQAPEARFRTQQERFRSLIENTSDVISILDEDGIIRYMSPSLERVLGFVPAELIGRSGFDCFHPDDVTRARQSFSQVLEQPGLHPVGGPGDMRHHHDQS